MTTEEILAKAKPLNVEFRVENDKVFFLARFECYEQDEPHDVAWSLLYDLNELLRPNGLWIIDSGSDNDSLWGEITDIPASFVFNVEKGNVC